MSAYFTNGNAQLVVGLLPVRTDTRWWHDDVASSAAVGFLRRCLSFGDCDEAAPFPSALAVWGGATAELAALRTALPDAWQPGMAMVSICATETSYLPGADPKRTERQFLGPKRNGTDVGGISKLPRRVERNVYLFTHGRYG